MVGRTWIVLITLILVLPSHVTSIEGADHDSHGRSSDQSRSLLSNPPTWSDSFNDNSQVHITRDVSVGGGRVEILAGRSNGIVSSEDIICPMGHRYDWLTVMVDTTGNSTVNITVLNATATSQQQGYVNEPIPGFELRAVREVDLKAIDPKAFPRIRLQATMEVNGSYRPLLLEWTVLFIRYGDWRDDFVSEGKILQRSKLTYSDGSLDIDFSVQNRYGIGYGDHERFPTLVANRYWHAGSLPFYIYYPNAQRNDYLPRVTQGDQSPRGFAFGDLDKDGNLDMVVANNQRDEDINVTSHILWGDTEEKWVLERSTNLSTYGCMDVAIGDVDCDGWLDLAFACWDLGDSEVLVYLNPGSRAFDPNASIVLPSLELFRLQIADLNNDGYGDIVLAENQNTHAGVYFGGPGGPDAEPDIRFQPADTRDVLVDDLDGDGFLDVVFANHWANDNEAYVYMGGPGGPDAVPDFKLQVPDTLHFVASGDINGDGNTELVFGYQKWSNPTVIIFWGTSSGWSGNNKEHIGLDYSMWDGVLVDINKDGYDDLYAAVNSASEARVYFGSRTGLDNTADVTLSASGTSRVAVAIPPKEVTDYSGSLITQAIDRPGDKKWDLAYVEADVPDGTRVLVDVLNRNLKPIRGYSSMPSRDIDISAIDDSRIHLRVHLVSESPSATPVVHGLLVKWMDRNVWRDEFYGEAKVSRMVGLDVTGGEMGGTTPLTKAREILVTGSGDGLTSLGENLVFSSNGGVDYKSLPPRVVTTGSETSAASTADVNGDGYPDVVFATFRSSQSNYSAKSPLLLGSPVGFQTEPHHIFHTLGARDVHVGDLNEDGHVDVVFAQERDGNDYFIESDLYWGSSDGWNATPDIEFTTSGAVAVEVVDLDRNGLDDIVFANYKGATTSVDSLVFLQNSTGFCGTEPSHYLGTEGAMGVSSGDLNWDGRPDLVFANHFADGFVTTDSYIYWGKASGGFEVQPSKLATIGATDVLVVDVNNDFHLDIVFANEVDDYGDYHVKSYVYLNQAGGVFNIAPDEEVRTPGASSIAVADLDGTGWMDIVVACRFDGVTHEVPTRVFLGDASGYSLDPDLKLLTTGATDVLVTDLAGDDEAGYLSQRITPIDPHDTGHFEVLRFNTSFPMGKGSTVTVVDADSWEVLFTSPASSGTNSMDLSEAFRVKEHPAVRLMITFEDTASVDAFRVDDIWLNWSRRVRSAPEVTGLTVDPAIVHRTEGCEVSIQVMDEYDLPEELTVQVEHSLNGSDVWTRDYLGSTSYSNGSWHITFLPPKGADVGGFDLRVTVEDLDYDLSVPVFFGNAITVLNNPPSTPEVTIEPVRPETGDTISVKVTRRSTDKDSSGISYVFAWSVDGKLQEALTGDSVPPSETAKGENWSVEVRAFDGIDHSVTATAWIKIQNSAPEVVSEVVPASIWEG
jgi:hypothetical protein